MKPRFFAVLLGLALGLVCTLAGSFAADTQEASLAADLAYLERLEASLVLGKSSLETLTFGAPILEAPILEALGLEVAAREPRQSGGALGCGWIPTSRRTQGRTYNGRPVGGVFRSEIDPWLHPERSQPFKLASRQRYGIHREADRHYQTPSGGWCEGSRCGLGVHGYASARMLLQWYADRPSHPRLGALRGLGSGCQVSPREAVDLYAASGRGWTLLAAWQRDRGGPPPPTVPPVPPTPPPVPPTPPTDPPAPPTTCPAGETCVELWRPAARHHERLRFRPSARSTGNLDLVLEAAGQANE